MGMMRWAQRGKNEYRRNLRRHLGESIHSLTDPGFERPPEPQMFPPPPGPDMIPPEGPGGEYGFDDDDGDSQASGPMPGQYPDDDERGGDFFFDAWMVFWCLIGIYSNRFIFCMSNPMNIRPRSLDLHAHLDDN